MQKMGNFEEKRKKLLHIVRLRKYKIREVRMLREELKMGRCKGMA